MAPESMLVQRPHQRVRVLYLVYWGAAEPLGQALVLPAVKKLAELGAELSLVTFEKPADLARPAEMAAIRASLQEHGIRWRPLVYHKRPKFLAKGIDFLRAWAHGLALRLGSRFDIVHARTYVGGLMSLPLARMLRARFIYHNEGFYPDEQVDAGVWRARSVSHRLAKSLEHRLYATADGIIALSHRAKEVIEHLPEVMQRQTPITVVPSCVDLTHFAAAHARAAALDSVLRFAYVGNVGGRYQLDKIGRFVAAARSVGPVHLRILTRAAPELVRESLRESQLPEDAWSMESVAYAAMPAELSRQHAGIHFLPQGLGAHGGSPTKIGEYWASGLPVVATPNMGDTEEIIHRERVGVLARGHTEAEYRASSQELRGLLTDPDLSRRCRLAAERHYALDAACQRQIKLYRQALYKSAFHPFGETAR